MKENLRLRAILLLVIAIVATSCTRDIGSDRMDIDQDISFIPSWSGTGKLESTKSESTQQESANQGLSQSDHIFGETVSGSVLNLDGDMDVYLHTTTTQGIDLGYDIDSDVISNSQLTKSAPVTEETMYDKFGISAYKYTGSWREDKTPNLFYDIPAVKSVNSYVLTPSYLWPGSSYKVRFFAYAPKDNAQYVLSDVTHKGSPTISATIPAQVSEQRCLLVSQSGELNGDNNTPVSLIFDHTLTAVKFVCDKDMQKGLVKSITLKNVYSKGLYNMGTSSWGNQDTPANFTQELNRSITGSKVESVTTESETFIMLPQTLPDNAEISVVFTDNTNTDYILTAKLKGQVWPKGNTVTYKLSSSPINWTYTLDVIPSQLEFEYTGGTNTYTVTSYRENGNGVKEPVKWRAEYSTDNGASWISTKPEWLTTFTDSGNGGQTAQSYNATVTAETGTGNTHTDKLKGTASKGSSSSPYNLSNSTGASSVQNTANCYVVNAPGYYSFPLVYGNAIKNGSTNSSAYSTTVSNPTSGGGETLKNFLNHAGEIKGPYIDATNDCNPSKAELVWQDAPSLVTNIKYNSGSNGGTISFEVNRSSIQQGNAVIAVKDESNTVLWSWHIWVTDEDINSSIAVTNRDGVVYNFMPVNLGWCDGGTTTYPESICKVRFMATEGAGIVKELTIRRKSGSVVTKGNNPYYEFGRKDPFQPSDGKGKTTKTWYNSNGTSSTADPVGDKNFGTGSTCIKNYILKPNVFNTKREGDNLYSNLWSADNNVYSVNNNTVVKTIYDPSPVGYHMPASAAFTGFTTTGGSANTLSQIKGNWDNTNKGWNFTANGGKTIYFPASGYRSSSDGSLRYVLSYGCYWSDVPNSVNYGRDLLFYSSYVSPEDSSYRSNGFPVRPARE